MGGKKPIFIFQEGVGFIENPKEGITLRRRTDGVSFTASKIRLTYVTEEGSHTYSRFSIGKAHPTTSQTLSINWAEDFPEYQTLYVECYRDASSGLRRCGLSNVDLPVDDSEEWDANGLPPVGIRSVVSFDLAGKAASFISAIGGAYTGNRYGEIYNIWLE